MRLLHGADQVKYLYLSAAPSLANDALMENGVFPLMHTTRVQSLIVVFESKSIASEECPRAGKESVREILRKRSEK